MKIDFIKEFDNDYYRCYKGTVGYGNCKRIIHITEIKMENKWKAEVETFVNGCSHYLNIEGHSRRDILIELEGILKGMGIV